MPDHRHIDLSQNQRSAPTYRFLGHVSPSERTRTPLLEDTTTEDPATGDGADPSGDPTLAVIRLYDAIDSWGGMWGVSSGEFIDALDSLSDSVETIELHINSPGGEVWEAIAMYNALVDHPAAVNVIVDGLAASAASLVAMAGDTITMNTATQMMIHDAWTLAIGNPSELLDTATKLDALCNNVAQIYADQAGGKAKDWRNAMQAETWYSPKEAVDAGLATTVAKKQKSSNNGAQNKFDLSIFNYAGREHAPAPSLDTKIGKSRANLRDSSKKVQQENKRVDSAQLEVIGLDEDATDDEVTARLQELVANQAETTNGDGDEADKATEAEADKTGNDDDKTSDGTEGAQASFSAPKGTVLVDEAQWAAVQNGIRDLNQMKADAAKKDRDDYLVAAMSEGKFPPASRQHYEALWDSNPQGTKALIDSLAKNTVPVQAVGRGDDAAGNADEDSGYPDSWKNSLIPQQGARR